MGNEKNTDKDFETVFSIIETENFLNVEEADSFINLLTNNPDPVREAVALKLNEISDVNFFLTEFSLSKLTNGITDINPNVSRAVINFISKHENLKELMKEKVFKKLESLVEEIKIFEQANKENFNKNNKNHAKNKKLFSLYWLLEAFGEIYDEKYKEKIIKILNFTINFSDYTIREKTARILAKMENAPTELLQKAKADQNFYVKIQVYDKMNHED